MAFHNNLTPFLGEDATEYAPEHETTTEFMNGKFQEVLDNDLWLKINTVKTYKSLTEINPNFTINTPVKDVILAMENNSQAMYDASGGVYPNSWGICTINKLHNVRNNVVYYDIDTNILYTTSYHTTFNPNCDWEKLVAQKKIPIISNMLKNGWQLKTNYNNLYVMSDKTLSLNLAMIPGTTTENTIICEGLPAISENVPISINSNNQTHLGIYTSDGKISLNNSPLPTGSLWWFINATINL